MFFVVFNLSIVSVTNSQSFYSLMCLFFKREVTVSSASHVLKVWKQLENHRFLITPRCVLS